MVVEICRLIDFFDGGRPQSWQSNGNGRIDPVAPKPLNAFSMKLGYTTIRRRRKYIT